VILSSGPDAAEPGRPWEATIELNEFRHIRRPVMTATRGDRRVTARLRPVDPSVEGGVTFMTRIVFPTAGRWRVELVSGKRSFAFGAIPVGSGVVPQDYAAFPEGSYSARTSGGGVYLDPSVGAGGDSSPAPETITYADAHPGDDGGDGGGVPLWPFPLAGVVLAGVGAAAVSRRGSR
jgi:hypothetical protein